MNKTRMTLAVIGGISGLAILAAGAFVWMQTSARTAALEGDDDGTLGLDSIEARANQLMRQKIRPCAESVQELEAAREEIVSWKEDAFRLAARGDRPIAKLTEAAFKEFLIRDSKRLLMLSPDANSTNVILDASFEFGLFKPYIVEGKLPEPEKLKTLQRNWDDFSTILETLAAAGVMRVSAIEMAKNEAPKEDEEASRKNRKKFKKNKKAIEPAFKPESFTYAVTCMMRPAALVKALNLFQTIERFVVVDDFSLLRSQDLIQAAFSEKKEEVQVSSRRGRRGRAAREEVASEKKPTDGAENAVITDPTLESPMEVRLTLTIHDLRSMEEPAKEEDAE